jgi:hypothetical protein
MELYKEMHTACTDTHRTPTAKLQRTAKAHRLQVHTALQCSGLCVTKYHVRLAVIKLQSGFMSVSVISTAMLRLAAVFTKGAAALIHTVL